LPALEQVRDQMGEVGFAGLWWDEPPEWAEGEGLEPALRNEAAAFRRLRIRVDPPVPYSQVIRKMSTGRVNIFTQRPVLAHLKHLTGRYFEEFCADTVPLLMLEPGFAEEVYGPATELTMPGRVAENCSMPSGAPSTTAHCRGDPPPPRRAPFLQPPCWRLVATRRMMLKSARMNVLFVMEPRNNAGCTQALANYARASELPATRWRSTVRRLSIPGMRLCTDVKTFGRIIYVFESELYRVSRLREVAMLG
jgi:hypothetical protein